MRPGRQDVRTRASGSAAKRAGDNTGSRVPVHRPGVLDSGEWTWVRLAYAPSPFPTYPASGQLRHVACGVYRGFPRGGNRARAHQKTPGAIATLHARAPRFNPRGGTGRTHSQAAEPASYLPAGSSWFTRHKCRVMDQLAAQLRAGQVATARRQPRDSWRVRHSRGVRKATACALRRRGGGAPETQEQSSREARSRPKRRKARR